MNVTMWPGFAYRDAPAAIHFLVTGLGFEAVAVHRGDTEGWIHQAVLRWHGGGILVLHSAEPQNPAVADLGESVPFGVYLHTDDPDALYDRAINAGGSAVLAPRDSQHGTRDAAVRDPEGAEWTFGTYQGD